MDKDSGGGDSGETRGGGSNKTAGSKLPKREGSGGSSGTSGISSGGVSETSSDTSEPRRPTQNPSSNLLALCERGEWLVFEQRLRALEKGSLSISVADPEHGVTPLMIAVKENRTLIIEKLLELGANVNEQAKDGRTALHFAACYSREDTIRLLLGRKADPFIPAGPYNQLPLHMACARSGAPVGAVQCLLRASGKDARFLKDKNGSIPLFLAVEAGSLGVTKELLSQQPEPQLKSHKQFTGDTALHMACRLHEQDIVKHLLECGATIDDKNKEGQTGLHLAAYEGDETMVKYLVSMKANSNILDKEDKSPLHIATERGHTNIVDLLIDKYKTSVSARTKDGNTLMHIASSFGHPETALAFLKRGVPLLMPNKEGAICLHSAAMRGHVSVIKALLQKGAAVDAKTKSGYTALHLAVEHCKPQVVQILLGYGAQIDLKGGPNNETPLHIAARTKEGEKCAEMLLKSGANVNATKENGETPLHVAAMCGQLNMIPALLDDGADPMQMSKSGETPVHVAVRFSHLQVITTLLNYVARFKSNMDAVMLANQPNHEGETPVHLAGVLSQVQAHDEFEDTDIINYLLDFQGDLNVQTRLTAETPLHYCAGAGNTHIMLEMVRHIKANNLQGAINKQDKNGQSPLLVASEHGHHKIVKILLKHHARVDVFDEHGKAALHLACENGHRAVADILLWHKAFVNAKSKQGLSPLHLAAANGYNALVKLLLETHSAAIDACSLAKKTPLHMAAQMGQMLVCSTLLQLKADPNTTDERGQTPLHLAAGNDHSDVVKLFLKHRPELVTMASTDENGMTCAHIAAAKGSVAVIKELMRFNKVIITTAKNKTKESSALHLAIAGGHKEVVETLLGAGASPTDEDADGMTAIHLAAKHGHISILDVLKGYISWKSSSRKTGLTALHVAAHYGQTEFVREMLTRVPATLKSESPASPPLSFKDLTQESGLTPLHLAAQTGHEGVVRLLLNCPGVQVDAPSALLGSLPIHYASQNGHTTVMSLLLSKSTFQLHTKDKRGRTALHLAAANGHIDMVALLLGQGADINASDKNGWSALHFASKAGYLAVVKLLVETGASPRLETTDGKVAVTFAAANNHSDVLSFLMKKDHSTQALMDDKKFVFDLMQCGKLSNNKSLREFILLSPAPPDTAAKLSKTLRLLSTREKERMRDLMAAADYCETMATDLTAIAASLSSAQQILKAVDCQGAQFLDVLIENEQKEVVAHPSVQKYLSDVWIGGLNWSLWKTMLLFLSLLIIPVLWIGISLPTHYRLNKVPIIKFMTYLVSHIYMMLLYFFMVAMPLHNIYDSGSLIPWWNEWLLLAWLSGLLVSELTNPGDRAGLGWIQAINLGISAIGIFCHLLAFAYQHSDDRYLLLYVRNNFFAWALLLSFVQLLDFLSFHHLFGPWAIIIRDLMRDLMRFLVILLIFMVGFTLHLSALYQPVYPEDSTSIPQGTGHVSEATSLTPIATFEFLFFALFGLVEPDALPPISRSPVWVMDLVKVVFGTYMMVTLIVLINLLIAMMSDTYQRIQQQSDTEWKFGRAKLIRNMNKTSATPSPLNLFTKAFTYIRVFIKYRGRVCSTQAQEFIHQEEDLESYQDNHSLDMSSHGGWLKHLVRRNTQVAPEVGFMAAPHLHGATRIEDVVDWKKVVQKYLLTSGQDEAVEELIGSMSGDKSSYNQDLDFKDDTG
ncbi:serine/threonine-protein phosphatase 6 regulatory ankyrin repeat subunit B-like [Littorina saxatilis]|uniref:serine/threonine-protein phosphatase 6 regulatory ankyrin repeat subunit B-like n=1 Tax=Littorina saxatilis TaxID=31220 RepID=UPI0038B63B67